MRKIFLILLVAFAAIVSAQLAAAYEWEYLNSNVTNDLNSISCPNERTCYVAGGAQIIGGEGIVLKTTNGGETWERQSLPTTEPLNSIKCADAETCYAAGDRVILKKSATTPWTAVNRSSQTVWDIDAASPAVAVAVGNLGTRLRTTNGGATWSGYLPPISGTFQPTLSNIFFIDEERGWIVGDEGTLRYTGDGGATWDSLNSSESLSLSDIFSFDGETIWVCGAFSHISKSTDSASSWADYSIPSMGGCGAIEFANSTFGWLFGNGGILQSIDGGERWEMISGLERAVFFRDIECFGPDLCYGAGDDGVIIRYGEPAEAEEPEEPEEMPNETETPSEDNEEVGQPRINTSIPPVHVSCPAVMDDCEAGWFPDFEYNSVGCAVNYTCIQESALQSSINEALARIMPQIPGLGANERINVYAAKSDGSKKVWGLVIENKKLKDISSSELEKPTFIVETSMQTLQWIISSSDAASEALAAIKKEEIIIKPTTFGGKIKLAVARIMLFFYKLKK
ncbi:hypothetical protein HYT92_01120 [Candidatus Pacearchaeota archaeon]|nr:hypothetical protein [Candidatus Pacearchaeota archaeon]